MKTPLKLSLSLLAALIAAPAFAEDMPVMTLVIKDHKFTPAILEIPADTKIELHVKNEDPTPEEFESNELNREKIIPGGTEATLYIGPLKPGEYGFFGEFNMDTAQGKIIVK